MNLFIENNLSIILTEVFKFLGNTHNTLVITAEESFINCSINTIILTNIQSTNSLYNNIFNRLSFTYLYNVQRKLIVSYLVTLKYEFILPTYSFKQLYLLQTLISLSLLVLFLFVNLYADSSHDFVSSTPSRLQYLRINGRSFEFKFALKILL